MTTYYAVLLADGQYHLSDSLCDHGIVSEYHGHLHPSFWGKREAGMTFVMSVDDDDVEKLDAYLYEDDAVFYYQKVGEDILTITTRWNGGKNND
jgi:hypothetical protein